MMKNTKKTYIAPAAELILLAPLEALAAPTSQDDSIALRRWRYGVFSHASATGSNLTCWGEDGTIPKK